MQIRKVFRSCGIKLIQPKHSIAATAKAASKSYTHIIACGGDGTANKVAQGLIGTSAIMGVLPFGSGNDFSRSLGMTPDFNENLKILLRNKTIALDLLEREDGGIMINTLGLGLDGLTNFFASKSKLKNGSMRYLMGGIKALIASTPFECHVMYDEEFNHLKTWMVTFANGTTEGGRYKISPGSNHADGELEIIILKPVSRLKLMIEFAKLSLGRSFDPDIAEVYKFSQNAQVEVFSEVRVHCDGEPINYKKMYKFNVKPSSLRLLAAI